MTRLIEVSQLVKLFPIGGTSSGRRAPRQLHAVDNVSFNIDTGESVGLVGESGCGKSTLARVITRLIEPSGGDVIFQGRNLFTVPVKHFATSAERAKIQMVFQDPTDSLNPRFTVFDTIAEPLRLLAGIRDRDQLHARVHALADQVGLAHELTTRFPHQLSGGQKARVGIARAIALHPKLLILDEPTSALDVSVQAVILHLLADLREQLGMSYLFVSHDLNVVRLLCDRVIVMYLGKIVESGPVAEIFRQPRHPYTQALIAAIPGTAPDKKHSHLDGEPRSPIDPAPTVCRLVGRCPIATDQCEHAAPALRAISAKHQVACHYAT
ncbi:MAG: peptide ABC transporter ATP-binding protein [Candidatus Muproteobacteria bacterium RBG_16_60_9]|uniref:Peptide ABC transporter ATP-binding protein n=1 Tax=Candidatus Muproteobacteria bacterium RBG_16_60_9 TaxID=1817755 RepID=A0A1F6UX35_9PROT|nr:MAG: peptide ABC transporter ATP-binding protein [Candidatus Muproteobacteria bacterium RBG_16_60_9]